MKQYKIIKSISKILIGFSVLSVFAVIVSTNLILKADNSVPTPDFTQDYPGVQPSSILSVGSLLNRGLEFLEWFIGTLALIGFIIAGIMFGMSEGNPEKATKAKKALIYTAVGVILSVLALVLTRAGFFVMNNNP